MNLYLEPQGFLGTGASLLADITLLAYLLLIIPAMLIGFWYARRGKHRPHHKVLMNGVTILNWVLIIFLMLAAYRFDVIDNIAGQPTNARYLLPTIHGLLGIPAQILATFIMIRMEVEDRNVAAAKRRGETNLRQYWFLRAKPVMQITLALWLATAALGVASYLVRYNVIAFTAATPDGAPAPVATDEVEATPEVTPELFSLIGTPEVAATAELFNDPLETPEVELDDDDGSRRGAPVATAEVQSPAYVVTTPEVVSTPEVEDDDSRDDDDDSGNSGSGSSNSGSGNSGSGSRDDDDD